MLKFTGSSSLTDASCKRYYSIPPLPSRLLIRDKRPKERQSFSLTNQPQRKMWGGQKTKLLPFPILLVIRYTTSSQSNLPGSPGAMSAFKDVVFKKICNAHSLHHSLCSSS